MKRERKNRQDYSKLLTAERVQKVEQVYVSYPRNKKVLEQIAYIHHHAKVAAEPEGLLLEGLAGMGKTTLLRHYLRGFPRRVTKGGTIVPVLLTRIEVPASPKSLVTALLRSIGDPLPDKGSQVSQTIRLKGLMDDCETELVMLDEFQHFIDRDSKKILKTTSDWLKNLMDDTGTPIVLAGMPYSHTILDAEGNEQLRRRFSMRFTLDPFNWNIAAGRKDFRRFLEIVDERLPLNEWSNLSDAAMAFRFYDATQGVVSRVMKVIRLATAIAINVSAERLDLDILSLAYQERLAADNPQKENPFGDGAKKVTEKLTKKDKSVLRATNCRSKASQKKLKAADVLP